MPIHDSLLLFGNHTEAWIGGADDRLRYTEFPTDEVGSADNGYHLVK